MKEVLVQANAEHLLRIPPGYCKNPWWLDTTPLQPLLRGGGSNKELETEQQLESYFEQENES